jgi:hypothetical protein
MCHGFAKVAVKVTLYNLSPFFWAANAHCTGFSTWLNAAAATNKPITNNVHFFMQIILIKNADLQHTFPVLLLIQT